MFMKINRITCHRPTTTTTVIPQTYSVGAYVEYTMSVSITGVSSIVIRFTKATSSSVTGKTTWTTTSSSSADYLFTDSSRYPQLHLVDGYSDCSKLPTSGSYTSQVLKEYKSTCKYPCRMYLNTSQNHQQWNLKKPFLYKIQKWNPPKSACDYAVEIESVICAMINCSLCIRDIHYLQLKGPEWKVFDNNSENISSCRKIYCTNASGQTHLYDYQRFRLWHDCHRLIW